MTATTTAHNPASCPVSDPRDDLAALIRDTIRARYVNDNSPEDVAYINDDDPIDSVYVDGYLDLRALADVILEGGFGG
jgi:hypothetical protein